MTSHDQENHHADPLFFHSRTRVRGDGRFPGDAPTSTSDGRPGHSALWERGWRVSHATASCQVDHTIPCGHPRAGNASHAGNWKYIFRVAGGKLAAVCIRPILALSEPDASLHGQTERCIPGDRRPSDIRDIDFLARSAITECRALVPRTDDTRSAATSRGPLSTGTSRWFNKKEIPMEHAVLPTHEV